MKRQRSFHFAPEGLSAHADEQTLFRNVSSYCGVWGGRPTLNNEGCYIFLPNAWNKNHNTFLNCTIIIAMVCVSSYNCRDSIELFHMNFRKQCATFYDWHRSGPIKIHGGVLYHSLQSPLKPQKQCFSMVSSIDCTFMGFAAPCNESSARLVPGMENGSKPNYVGSADSVMRRYPVWSVGLSSSNPSTNQCIQISLETARLAA